MMAVTYLNLVYIFRSWGIIIITITGFSNIRFMEGGGSWRGEVHGGFTIRVLDSYPVLVMFAGQSYSSFDSFH